MDIYVSDIQYDIIKPSDNGGFVSVVDSITHRVMISDTTLSSFIPPQVWKITHKLRQICWYDLCPIPKDMKIYLFIFRTWLVTYSQHNSIWRHTLNSLFITTSDSH